MKCNGFNYRKEFHFCLWERSCISKWPLMLAGKMTVNSQDLLEIAVIFYNLYLIVWLLSLLPCLWGILLGRKSLSQEISLFSQSLRHARAANMLNKLFAWSKHTSTSFTCWLQTSRQIWKPHTTAEKTNVLFVAAIFSSFYLQICVFASRPSHLFSYLSTMMWPKHIILFNTNNLEQFNHMFEIIK